MVRNPTIRRKIVALVVVLSTVGFASPALAQDGGADVTLRSAEVQIDAGETSTVTAEYEFDVASAGSGESALTAISGTLWKVADGSPGSIQATVDGESVEPTVTEQSRHYVVSVPVEGVEDGDTVTVQLQYEISGPSGELRAPLWVPEHSAAGETSVVHTTVSFPEGTYPQGDSFPNPSSVSGNTAQYDTLHVPGFVSVSYDDTPSGFVTMNGLYSTAGVLIILGLVAGGLLVDRRTGRGGGR